jgi:putative transposase
MPRKPRFYLPGIPAHIVQRGNDRQAVFFADSDYQVYLDWMFEGAQRHGCSVHAYVLMTNHVHILVTPKAKDSISRMIQFVGRKYVTYINHLYGRTGTLWEGRHKGSLIDSERYALACSRYIEMNPVRARMVKTPEEYPWSSYRVNALGATRRRLVMMPEYCRLGATDDERQSSYRKLFDSLFDNHLLSEIQGSVQSGTPLGSARFRKQIEAMFGRRIGYSTRGRPKKVE